MANVLTPAKTDDFIPEIWANRALTVLEAELHLARNVARDSDFTTAKVGDVVNIPKTGALTANQKVAGTAVTLQNPDSTGVNVTIDQHWEVSFIVDDVAKAQANQDVMDRYIGDGVKALGEKIETALASLYGSLTAGNVNSGGGAIVIGDIRTARGNLSTNRAPQSDRFLYLSPDAINDVLGMDEFIDASKYGSNMPIQDGEFGKVYGFRVFESLFTQTGGSPEVTYNLYMHKNAMVLAMRALPTPKAGGVKVAVVDYQGLMLRVLYSYNADQLGDQVTIDCLYGVSTLRPELGDIIER